MTGEAHIDFETRSEVDIKLAGAWRYADDPTTRPLLLGIEMPGGRRLLWAPSAHPCPWVLEFAPVDRLVVSDEPPDELARHVERGDPVAAHNAPFELAVWSMICGPRYGWPVLRPEQLRCSMALCGAAGIPLSLGGAGAALGLGVDEAKSAAGRRLMLRLCTPQRPSKARPSKWVNTPDGHLGLAEYCMQDVTAEKALFHRLPPLPELEQKVFIAHLYADARGFRVDQDLIHGALKLMPKARRKVAQELSTATHRAVQEDDLGRIEHMLTWCRSRGTTLPNWRKETLRDELKREDLPEDVRAVLRARLLLGRSSTKKLDAMRARVQSDGRVRGNLQYHGAFTGRWAGRGVQPQNMPRPTVPGDKIPALIAAMKAADVETAAALADGDPFEAIASSLRSALVPAPHRELLCVDYAQIEARVAFWLAGDRVGLEAIRKYDAGEGPDLYRVTAGRIYGRAPEEIEKGSVERQLGKAAALGLQYGMGAAKFALTCADQYGIHIDEETARRTVRIYRETFTGIPKFWRALERAAKAAVDGHRRPPIPGGLRYELRGDWLECWLPAKRAIRYFSPRIILARAPWDAEERVRKLTYMTVTTKGWQSTDTWGGKLCENVVQAVARDLMAEALVRVVDAGFRPVLTVHDELVAEARKLKDERAANQRFATFTRLIEELPGWAGGCPVVAEGWRGDYYRK